MLFCSAATRCAVARPAQPPADTVPTPPLLPPAHRSAEDCVIPARGKRAVHTGLSIAVPHGTYGRVAPRSGLAAKHFIDVGAGVIDEDYRGEVLVLLFNHADTDFAGESGWAVGCRGGWLVGGGGRCGLAGGGLGGWQRVLRGRPPTTCLHCCFLHPHPNCSGQGRPHRAARAGAHRDAGRGGGGGPGRHHQGRGRLWLNGRLCRPAAEVSE